MAELVYAYVSEAYPVRVESSSLSPPTENRNMVKFSEFNELYLNS